MQRYLIYVATHSICNELIDAVARARYKKKQELVGLRTCPYELGLEAWMDDVTLWSPVEFPDIVLYLWQTP